MPITIPTYTPSDPDSVRRAFSDLARAIGGGFHPDTRAAQYVHRDTGARLFTDDEARAVDALVEAAFGIAGCPYETALIALGLLEPCSNCGIEAAAENSPLCSDCAPVEGR